MITFQGSDNISKLIRLFFGAAFSNMILPLDNLCTYEHWFREDVGSVLNVFWPDHTLQRESIFNLQQHCETTNFQKSAIQFGVWSMSSLCKQDRKVLTYSKFAGAVFVSVRR